MRGVAHWLVGSCCSRSSRHDVKAFSDEFGEDLAGEDRVLAAPIPRDEGNRLLLRGMHGGETLPTKGYFSPPPPLQDLDPPVREQFEDSASIGHFLSSLATVTVALMVYFYEAASYNIIFLGRILPARDKAGLVIPFGVTFNVVWFMAIWSYLQAHLSDPGLVPRRWHDFARSLGDQLPVAPPRLEWQPGKATWCKRCSIARPERAHHCNVCGICVLRMDHHCPYIFNCVGFNNHKYFLLLIVYTTSACAIMLLTTLPDFLYYLCMILDVQEDPLLQSSEVWGFIISVVLDVFLMLILAPMVPAHITLACRNQTSIEGNYNNMPNPFDHRAVQANLQEIFGAYGADWIFPVPPSRPLGDGVSFSKAEETDDLDFSTEDADEGPEKQVERLWRARYGVRRQQHPYTGRAPLGSPREAVGPLDAISLWWRSL